MSWKEKIQKLDEIELHKVWDTDQASGFASYDGLGMVHLLCQNADVFGFSFIDFEFGAKVVFLCWLCFLCYNSTST